MRNNYIDKKKLYEEIIKCKKASKLSNSLFEMIYLIVINSNKKLSYENEQDREDCIQVALEVLLKKWDRFDETMYTNAFAYYTQISKNAFAKARNELHKIKTSDRITIDNNLKNI